jgi:hypothetical protein
MQLFSLLSWLLQATEELFAVAVYPGALVLALLLLVLLALREVARVSVGPRWQEITHLLSVGIAPLLVIFIATVVVRVITALE